jgi:hypothetical protein
MMTGATRNSVQHRLGGIVLILGIDFEPTPLQPDRVDREYGQRAEI